MKSIYTLFFLFLLGCSSVPSNKNTPVFQTAPKGSSGSLGKNIDELDSVMNKSLSRIDKILLNLEGK
jgi:hypothetical protein